MSLLYLLSDESVWERFYLYKQSLASPKQFVSELRAFIDAKRYIPVAENIINGKPFPLPVKSVISKLGSEKKRVVYTYPDDENTVLKLLTWLILRKYDFLFSPNLYSFRPQRTAKDAVRYLLKHRYLDACYSYKVDISDYFNSIPVDFLLPMLENVCAEDPELLAFLISLLKEPFVSDRGKTVAEKKGIMAGTPLSSFFANLFLYKLDGYFYEKKIIYARYSDDIIVFAKDKETVLVYADYIKAFLSSYKLSVNPSKEVFTSPGEGFTFLGFFCKGPYVDIAPATVKKLKQKMRRKRDALKRWKDRSEASGERAAKAFIRVFNRKLLENARDNELCWSDWFFPVISTSASLCEIDRYAQDCIRYLIKGKHTKARFDVRYEDIKNLGYKCLVHEYYSRRKQKSD